MIDGLEGDRGAALQALGSRQARPACASTPPPRPSPSSLSRLRWRCAASNRAARRSACCRSPAMPRRKTARAAILLGGDARQRRTAPMRRLAVLRTMPRGDPFDSEALRRPGPGLDRCRTRCRGAGAGAGRACQRSAGAIGRFRAGSATSFSAMERHGEAAAAYQRAVALGGRPGPNSCGRCSCCRPARSKSADRWPEAKAVLRQALARRAGAAAAAQFPRLCQARAGRGSRGGRSDDPQGQRACARRRVDHQFARLGACSSAAAPTKRSQLLRAAAKGDPTQAEIHEHLGDALFTAGRRFEARFAWSAALATAEDEDAGRLQVEGRERADAGDGRAVERLARSPTRSSTWRSTSAGKRPDGYHEIETIFAFCEDGDRLSARTVGRAVADRRRAVRAATSGQRLQPRPAGGAAAAAVHVALRPARQSTSTSGCRSQRASAAARPMRRRRCGCSSRLWGIDRRPARSEQIAPSSARRARLPCIEPAMRGTGRGDQLEPVDLGLVRHAGAAGQPARASCRPPRCSPAGTASIAGRSATGGRAATTSRTPAIALVPQIQRGAGLAVGAAGRRIRPHVGQRRDLLRSVRQRGAARPGCGRGAARMVAPRDPPALSAQRMNGRPILTAAAMRAAEQAAIDGGHQRRAADGAGRGGAGRGRHSLRRQAAGAGPVRAGQQWRRRLCRGAASWRSAGVERAGRGAWRSRRATPRDGRARRWTGPVETLADADAPARRSDRCIVRNWSQARRLKPLSRNSFSALPVRRGCAIACDLPSGVDSDSGAALERRSRTST